MKIEKILILETLAIFAIAIIPLLIGTYFSTIDTQSLNWKPGFLGFTNINFLFSSTFFLLYFCYPFVMYTFLVAYNKHKLAALLFSLMSAIYLINGSTAEIHKNGTRMLGTFIGTAKIDCWLPESYECAIGKGLTPKVNAPRIWSQSRELTEWAKKELEKQNN